LAEKLLNTYQNALAELCLIPSKGGAFEISVDGKLLYSKLETGRFPDERQVLRDIKAEK